MDYREIDQAMRSKSLAADPAFSDLHFLVESIPCFNGCPLGLYYPDTATIILPPDGTIAALMHELGHRHGHYYYGDLSEQYAENYRKAYQGGKVLLYSGNRVSSFPSFAALFNEGEKGIVEVALGGQMTLDQLREIKSPFYSYGEAVPRCFYGNSENPWVRFEFTKGVDWMTIIGATLAGTVVATVGIIGYAIYKVSETLPWIIPVSAFGVGLAFLLRAMAREARVRA